MAGKMLQIYEYITQSLLRPSGVEKHFQLQIGKVISLSIKISILLDTLILNQYYHSNLYPNLSNAIFNQ